MFIKLNYCDSAPIYINHKRYCCFEIVDDNFTEIIVVEYNADTIKYNKNIQKEIYNLYKTKNINPICNLFLALTKRNYKTKEVLKELIADQELDLKDYEKYMVLL